MKDLTLYVVSVDQEIEIDRLRRRVAALRRKLFSAIKRADRLRNATFFREPVPSVVLGPDDLRPDLGSLEVVVSARPLTTDH